MLVRDMLKLDGKGSIPQFLKDAWVKNCGGKYPVMETSDKLRLVRIDSWASTVLPRMVIPIFGMAIASVFVFLVMDGPTWLVLCLLMLTLAVSVLPRTVTLHVQSRTKTNFFNCSLTNILKWMKLQPEELARFSHLELSHLADEALVEQAKEILRLEILGGWDGDETLACRNARQRFRFMYDIFGHFDLVSDGWGVFFDIARVRITKAEKEEAEKNQTTPLSKDQRHVAWAALNEMCSWAWESAGLPSAQLCSRYLGETHPKDATVIFVPNLLGLKWRAQKANGKPTLKFRIARLWYFLKMGLKTDHLFPIDRHPTP